MNKYSLFVLFTILTFVFTLQVKDHAKHLMKGRIAEHNEYDMKNYEQQHQSQNDDIQDKGIKKHANQQDYIHQSDRGINDIRSDNFERQNQNTHDQYSQLQARNSHNDQIAQIDKNTRAHKLFSHETSTSSYNHKQQQHRKTNNAHQKDNNKIHRLQKIGTHDETTSSYTSNSDFRNHYKDILLNRNHLNWQNEQNYPKNQQSINEQEHDQYSRRQDVMQNKNYHKTQNNPSQQVRTTQNDMTNQHLTTNQPQLNVQNQGQNRMKYNDQNNRVQLQPRYSSQHHNKIHLTTDHINSQNTNNHEMHQPNKVQSIDENPNTISHKTQMTDPNTMSIQPSANTMPHSSPNSIQKSDQNHIQHPNTMPNSENVQSGHPDQNIRSPSETNNYNHNQNDLQEPNNGARYTYINENPPVNSNDYTTTQQATTRSNLNYDNTNTSRDESSTTSDYN